MHSGLHLLLLVFLILPSASIADIYHYGGISLPYVAVLSRNLTLTNSFQGYPLIPLHQYAATARCFPDIANSSYFQLCFVNTTSDSYTFSILTYDTTFDPKASSYINNSTAQVVWSANRNHPVHENAVVRLEEDGNLSLRDADGSLVWSTNTSNQGVVGISLDDWGNLVLYDRNNGTLWQSYDHPTDVLLQRQGLYPGMRLVSRVSDTDASEGSYSLVMEAGGLAAYYNNTSSHESDPYWVFSCYGENNLFSVQHTCNDSFYLDFDGGNTPYLQFFNVPNSSDVLKDESLKAPQLCKLNASTCSSYGWYFQYFDVSSSTFSEISSLVYFLRLENSGFLQALVYYYVNGDSSLPVWLNKTVLLEDTDACLPADACGTYGICSTGKPCTCPTATNSNLDDSFLQIQAISPSNRFSGCSPPRNLSCEKNTSLTNPHQHFLSLSGIDYFANAFAIPQNSTSLEDCLQICLHNCSCLAVFYHNHTGSCFPYSDQLASLQAVNNQSFLAFLKIEDADEPAQKSSIGTVVGIVIAVLGGISIMSVVLIWLHCRKRTHWTGDEEDDDENDEVSFLEKLSTLPTRYSYRDLQKITQDFGKTLGVGGFGKVYEGMLPNGDLVAVKKLESKNQGKKEFRAEVATLGGIHHVNLVRLCGFCAEGSSRLLVYEYMPNGSLDRWLFHGVESPRHLSWPLRFEIALGAARGLAYLHNECAERIFHLDVKPENILLDTKFTAKVADFGLSRLVKRDESFVETQMRGTRGYLAPEWLLQGGITEKADVYSFGVVLLEMVSGRRITDFYTYLSLAELDGGKVTDLMDLVGSAGNADEEQARHMILTGLHCIQEDPSMRPSMAKVAQMLEGTAEVAHLDMSKLYQGIYSALRTHSRPLNMEISTSSASSAALPSGGSMSLSVLEAR